jgi:hypothetical protein
MSMRNAFAKKNAGYLSELNSASLWVKVLLNNARMTGTFQFLEENWTLDDPTDFATVVINADRAQYHCSRSQLPLYHGELTQSLTQAKMEILDLIHHRHCTK